jgi:hypothetical protein
MKEHEARAKAKALKAQQVELVYVVSRIYKEAGEHRTVQGLVIDSDEENLYFVSYAGSMSCKARLQRFRWARVISLG